MLFAGRQVFRVERSQNRVFLNTSIEDLDKPVEGLVGTNRLVYHPHGVNHIHIAIIQPLPEGLNPAILWEVKELSVLARLYRPYQLQTGTWISVSKVAAMH